MNAQKKSRIDTYFLTVFPDSSCFVCHPHWARCQYMLIFSPHDSILTTLSYAFLKDFPFSNLSF